MNEIEPIITEKDVKVVWNNEEIKAALAASLDKYKNLLVTDENVKDMERARREVGSFRVKIETFKRRGRAELRKPMENFSAQCDELLALVKQVEEPLAAQLVHYEQARQNAMVERIRRAFASICAEMGVRPEFQALTGNPRWLNRTQRFIDTLEDLKKEAALCLQAQKDADAKKELKAMRREVLSMFAEKESAGLSTPVTLDEFTPDLLEMPVEAAKKIICDKIEERGKIEKQAREKADGMAQAVTHDTMPTEAVVYKIPETARFIYEIRVEAKNKEQENYIKDIIEKMRNMHIKVNYRWHFE